MNSRRRKWILAICAFIVFGLVAVLISLNTQPVHGTAIGISNMADGCVGYFFSITNRSERPLKVRLGRNEAPPHVSGVATIVQTTLAPKSDWNVALYPPDEPVPWSATLEYFPEPTALTKWLRKIAATLRIRSRDPQWAVVQTFQIEAAAK